MSSSLFYRPPRNLSLNDHQLPVFILPGFRFVLRPVPSVRSSFRTSSDLFSPYPRLSRRPTFIVFRPINHSPLSLSRQVPRASYLTPSSQLATCPSFLNSRLAQLLRFALAAGIFTGVVVVAVIAVFWIIQDSLVYKPVKVWRGSPGRLGMAEWDDVRYCTIDGVEIAGWFIKAKSGLGSRTLIYFHGTDKNASFRLKKVVGFWEICKCNILLLSYRGYGTSTGHPNEKGVCIDAESAYDYLKARGDVDVQGKGKLWVFGESLGGAVALHFAKRFESSVSALVLENTFTSLLDMIKLEFPILGVFRYLSRNKWRSDKRIRDLNLPILFLSGLQDSYIPPRMMRKLHQAASESQYTRFVEFENGTHNRTWTKAGYYEAIASFMDDVEASSLLEDRKPTKSSSTADDISHLPGEDGGLAAVAA